ncbi:hypothetical protein HZA38_06200 [Candidatus Peregrinibacteria bacterium]|nr:hypothetical protein [Candidatus Peregrinibacteria bacterium]
MNPVAQIPQQEPRLPSAAYDNKIYIKFSSKTLEKKAMNKEEFQKEFGLIPEKKTLLLGFSLPLTEKNGANVLSEILPGIEALGIQIAFLGIGTERYQGIVTTFAKENETHAVILENTDENIRKLNAGCDAMLFFSRNEENATALHNALSYGVVPIADKYHFPEILRDYNPNQEYGNSFLFESPEKWKVFATVVRTMENYRFPYDWKSIAREAMEKSEK